MEICWFVQIHNRLLSGLSRDREQLQPLRHSANILAQGLSIYFHPLFFLFFVKGPDVGDQGISGIARGGLTFMMRVAGGPVLQRTYAEGLYLGVLEEIGGTLMGPLGRGDIQMT